MCAACVCVCVLYVLSAGATELEFQMVSEFQVCELSDVRCWKLSLGSLQEQ